ncbi:MAG: hypothetical protein PHI71_02825 [Acidiphilium sp.]|nr:hypothetical protein [Acidiphilium sp.]
MHESEREDWPAITVIIIRMRKIHESQSHTDQHHRNDNHFIRHGRPHLRSRFFYPIITALPGTFLRWNYGVFKHQICPSVQTRSGCHIGLCGAALGAVAIETPIAPTARLASSFSFGLRAFYPPAVRVTVA